MMCTSNSFFFSNLSDSEMRGNVTDRIAVLSRKARALLAAFVPTPRAPPVVAQLTLASTSSAPVTQSSSSSSSSSTASGAAPAVVSIAPLVNAAHAHLPPPPPPPAPLSEAALRDELISKWGGVRLRLQVLLEPVDTAGAPHDGDASSPSGDSDGDDGDETRDGPSNAKRPRHDNEARNQTSSVRFFASVD